MTPSNDKHLRFLGCAREISYLSDIPKYRYGAVLVNNKAIIGSGNNSTKTHPLQAKLNKLRTTIKRNRNFQHAEVSVLAKMRVVPKGSVLYVYRSGAEGTMLMARPCEGCMSLIKARGITKIVYTTPDGYAVEELDNDQN